MPKSLSDEQRFPVLNARAQSTLQSTLKALQEHPHAPRFNYACGDQLDDQSLRGVRDYEREVFARAPQWRRGEVPDWLIRFVARVRREVPAYRNYPFVNSSDEFFALPFISRDNLAREPWKFVPDHQPLDEMLIYDTSGTSGAPLVVPADPQWSASYLPLLKRALETHGVGWPLETGHVALALVCAQQQTLTYATASSFLDGAAFVKINLNAGDWREADDRARFLNDCAPPIYTGDPIAFGELMKLPLAHQPRALVSSATTLSAAWRARLEKHFGCPVIDWYSMNETGPIAFSAPDGDGHEILPPDLFVEIVRPDGSPCEENERGEIVVSGGRNPFWPLLRYRTGDFASMRFEENAPRLLGFAGRAPVVYQSTLCGVVTSIDVARAMRPFPLSQWALHQNADGSLLLKIRGEAAHGEIERALREVFGAQTLRIEEIDGMEESKLLQYSSDVKL